MNDRGTIVDGTTVRFEPLLPGPIERAWSDLTEGPLLTTWLAEDGAIAPHPGEPFVLKMGGGDDMPEREGYEAAMYGTVLKYDPPHVLEYIWGVKSPDGPMLPVDAARVSRERSRQMASPRGRHARPEYEATIAARAGHPFAKLRVTFCVTPPPSRITPC